MLLVKCLAIDGLTGGCRGATLSNFPALFHKFCNFFVPFGKFCNIFVPFGKFCNNFIANGGIFCGIVKISEFIYVIKLTLSFNKSLYVINFRSVLATRIAPALTRENSVREGAQWLGRSPSNLLFRCSLHAMFFLDFPETHHM